MYIVLLSLRLFVLCVNCRESGWFICGFTLVLYVSEVLCVPNTGPCVLNLILLCFTDLLEGLKRIGDAVYMPIIVSIILTCRSECSK